MNLELPNEINVFVQGLVSQGRFVSEEAAVVEGIRLLMSREILRGEIQKGVTQLDGGQSFDEETVFNEINAEIDKIESSQSIRELGTIDPTSASEFDQRMPVAT